jgi:hypothetical protein
VSAFAYGRIIARHSRTETEWQELGAEGQAGKTAPSEPDPFLTSIAALIPADIIAAHAFILALASKTDEVGTTTITQPDLLRWSLVGLLAAAGIVYLFGRGVQDWVWPKDLVRLVLPPLGLLAWTALLGTSALTPWVGSINHITLVVTAVVGGVILLGLSRSVAPNAAP